MNDREHKALLKKLQGHLSKWEALLDLAGQWDINVETYRGGFDDRSDGAVMWTTADWQYRIAKIGIDLPLAMQETEERLEECIVHELLHVVLREAMEYEGQEHEEHVVTSLARSFMKVANSQGEYK